MAFIEETELQGIWKQPKPKYRPGRIVLYERKPYEIIGCSHTHAQLKGLKFAVPLWDLQPVKAKVQEQVSTYQPKGLVSTPENFLSINADLSDARSPYDLQSTLPTAKEK